MTVPPVSPAHPHTDARPDTEPTPTTLLRVFIGVALSGIGGGLPAHARRAMTTRRWLTDTQFAETYTLAQLTPGPNAVNLAAMIGARLCGPPGAFMAVMGILVPGLTTMLAAAALTLSGGTALPPVVQSGLRGAACAALAVMVSAVIPVVKVGLGVRGGLVLAGLTFVGLGVLRLNLLPVFAFLVGAGLILNRPRRTPPPQDDPHV
ncbi:chromate transporter [Deinococcus sp. KSM4-11]|uniref:chromate transporter n=1 Tax=Deinococcus sp. KSM4-11 TaxID=2568654 RepID=UPI0010A3B8A0|nr:chromate transporter [Deinococcus sp. KSM4-11]THF88542.1 chromate transporter [Deinococcus sp. KSM4-11]